MAKVVKTKNSRKRSIEDQKGGKSLEDQNDVTGEKKYSGNDPLLKLLVPNYVAGALIGKGGTLLNELKETYGTTIRISASRQYYPGTMERVVIILGDVNQIIETNNYIMEKVQDPGRDSTMKNIAVDKVRAEMVKIVLTNPAAGLLIGRNGLTIKTIQEESNAKIQICGIHEASVPGERVLTMSGSISERTEACSKIISKVAEYSSNMANTRLKYESGNVAANDGGYNTGFEGTALTQGNQFSVLSGNAMAEYRANSYMDDIPNQTKKTKLKARVEVEIDVPNEMVGGILGAKGSIVRDFVQRSGARFDFSEKSEAPERILTIKGDIEQANIAYSLVCQRLEELGKQHIYQGQ